MYVLEWKRVLRSLAKMAHWLQPGPTPTCALPQKHPKPYTGDVHESGPMKTVDINKYLDIPSESFFYTHTRTGYIFPRIHRAYIAAPNVVYYCSVVLATRRC